MIYELFKWYPVTDEAYWIDDENVATIIKSPYDRNILTHDNCPYGWGTMVKTKGFYFMNIDKTTKQ